MTATELVDEKSFLRKLKILEPRINHFRIGALMGMEQVRDVIPEFMHGVIDMVEGAPSWLIVKQTYKLASGDKNKLMETCNITARSIKDWTSTARLKIVVAFLTVEYFYNFVCPKSKDVSWEDLECEESILFAPRTGLYTLRSTRYV